eukprot:jgi/Bigna1/74169/fgenesh1_pg.28_\
MLRPRRPSLPPVSLVILSILSSSSCGHSRRVANRRAALRSISLLGAMGGLRNPPSSAYTGRLAELSRAPAGSRTKDYAGYGEDGEVQQALQLIRELRPGATLNDADEAVARAVSTLVETGRWEGSWRVVYAPHIRTLSASLLGTTFDVTYDIDGQGAIESNVRYSNPVLGSGWLSRGRPTPSREADMRAFPLLFFIFIIFFYVLFLLQCRDCQRVELEYVVC